MRPSHVLLLIASALFFSSSALSAQTYYDDIRPLMQENCLKCHSEDGVAWSMEDAAETYARRRAIGAAILTKKMPPWLAEGGHQGYVADLSLSSTALETVRSWVDAGHPLGEPVSEPAYVRTASSFQPDVKLDLLVGPYLPNQTRSDDYRCFLVEWPGQNVGYLTGFRTQPGNLGVAHHAVIYAVNPDMAERYQEFADDEEGPGYQCFGGSLPDRLGSRSAREAYEIRHPGGMDDLRGADFWLAHWAPGMDGYAFPTGTGVRIEPGSLLVVQMHYYSEHAPGESDEGTQLHFTVAEDVERRAFHYPLTENRWIGGERNGSMVVAPGQQATYETSVGLDDLIRYVSHVTQVPSDSITALEIHSANLHMHAFGHSGEITLTDSNGRVETLLSVPRWDLNWQRDFTFTQPKVFERKDLERARLAVRCTFENPTADMVYGGFGSDEEMCFNFSYIAVQKGAVTATQEGSRR